MHRAAQGAGGLRLLDRRLEETWLGWAELEARAERVAAGLTALGLEPGERVALIYPTGKAFFDAFFATLLAGAVPVPLYPPVRLGRLDEYHRRTAAMLRAAGARLVLADPRVARLLGETAALARPALGVRRLDELPDGSPAAGTRAPLPADLALVQFSSGTTVEPKPVALSHRAILAQTRALNASWPGGETIRHTGVSWLPLYHDMGLIGCVFAALALGTDLTLLPPEAFVARPALWLQAISRYRATVSPAPNFAYALAVERVRDEELEGVDLSTWRVALNGAETVAPPVLRAFCDRFARWGFRREALTPVYGLAEAALAVTFSDLGRPFVGRRFEREALAEGRARLDDAGVEIVSVGRPLAGFEVEIRSEDGRSLGAARVGHVWVRGPSLMDGYLDLPEATTKALRDGWLDTGDLGFLDEGELFLTGRAKDMVLLRGRNFAPAEIEQAVDPLPGVRTGCSVAASWLPEGADGERLVLLVETRKGISPQDAEALPERCKKEVLAAVGVAPDEVVVLEPGTLPRTSSGKLRRQESLRRWRAGELTPPDAVGPVGIALAFGRSTLAYARAGGRRGRG
ncbi:MAG: fatty acyl-AMP ligase [Acidobacteria bacterium]|nr:fatty acyl-AMP ligase [Acidobacteriota bacterium]